MTAPSAPPRVDSGPDRRSDPAVPNGSGYTPLDTAGLADQAHRALRMAILRRVHPPGSRLDIPALAREMGISTAPLRDAVRRLEVEGLVRIHPRRGTFVTEISAQDVREVFQVRRALELAAADAALTALSAADLQALDVLLAQFAAWLNGTSSLEYDEFLGLDAEFHRRIVAAAGNRLLARLYDSLQAHTHVARAKYVGGEQRRWQSLREHEAIVAALRARDRRSLDRAIRAHLAASEEDLLAHLARSLDDLISGEPDPQDAPERRRRQA